MKRLSPRLRDLGVLGGVAYGARWCCGLWTVTQPTLNKDYLNCLQAAAGAQLKRSINDLTKLKRYADTTLAEASMLRALGGGGGGGSNAGFCVVDKSKTASTQLHLRAKYALAHACKLDRSLLEIEHNLGQTTFAAFTHMGVLLATKTVGTALDTIGVLLMVTLDLAYTDKDRNAVAKDKNKFPEFQSTMQESIPAN